MIYKLLILVFFFILNMTNHSHANNVSSHISVLNINNHDGLLFSRTNTPIIDILFILKNRGTAYEVKTGLNEFTMELIELGSAQYKIEEFKNALDDKGINFSLYQDSDDIYIKIKTLKENLKYTLDLAFEAILNTNLSSNNFEVVKNKLLGQIKVREQDYSYLANYHFLSNIFKETMYEPKLLSVENVNQIDLSQLNEALKNRLLNSKVEVLVVGNLVNKETEDILKPYLKKFTYLTENKTLTQMIEPCLLPETINIKSNLAAAQTIIRFGAPSLRPNNKDYIGLQLVNDALGASGLNSLLMKRLREEMNITYGVRTSLNNAQYTEFLNGYLATGDKNISNIISEIKTIFDNLHKNGFTEAQLEDLRQRFKGKNAFSFANNEAILNSLRFIKINNLDLNYFNQIDEKLAQLKLEDLNHIAKNMIKADKLSFVNFN